MIEERAPRVTHAGASPREAFTSPRRPLREALGQVYWRYNTRRWLAMIVLDCDHVDPIERTLAGAVPPPTFVVWNDATGRAHAYYVLTKPVSAGPTSSARAVRYFHAVRERLTAAMGADPQYAHTLGRGPLAPGHLLEVVSGRTYTLGELDAPVARRSSRTALGTALEHADGRNCALFSILRGEIWGWPARFTAPEELHRNLQRRAAEVQAELRGHPAGRLPAREVASVVRSVYRYALKRPDARPSRPSLVEGGLDRSQVHSSVRPPPAPLEVQRARQAAGAQVTARRRVASTRARIGTAVQHLRRSGRPVTPTALIRETGLARHTIYRHRDLLIA